MSFTLQNPFIYFNNPANSNPVGLGKLYVGLPDLDPVTPANRVTVKALTADGSEITLSQPIQLLSGGIPSYNGSPVQLLIEAETVSIKVTSLVGAQVFYTPRWSAPIDVNTVESGYVRAFDTVAEMKATITSDWVGRKVQWLGYYALSDGGSNWGVVKSGSYTDDGFVYFGISGSLYVQANVTSSMSMAKAGVLPDNGNIAPRIAAAIAAANNLSSPSKLIGLTFPVGNLPISGGDATNPCIDLTNFKGAFFVGKGKARTILQYSGSADKVLALNRGVNGSNGSIENIEVGGFYIDCNSSTANYGVYADAFRRGRIFDMEVRGANVSYSYGYGWITRLKDLTSTNHKVKGFEFARASINGVTGENLSATTTVNTAVNFDILANSLTLIQPTSEGTPAKGILIKLGCRKINIIGGHTEGENTGIWNEATDQNGSNLTVDGMFFFSCNNPLVMSGRIRSLNFINNLCRARTTPADVVWQINAQQFEFDGNNIESANIAQEVAAISIVNSNSMDKAVVSADGFKTEFNTDEINVTDRDIVFASAGPHDIQTFKAVPAGCSGQISITCRVSGTDTSVHTVAYRVNEDNTTSFSNIAQLGTAIITAVGYNAGTSRVTVNIAVPAQGIPCFVEFSSVVD